MRLSTPAVPPSRALFASLALVTALAAAGCGAGAEPQAKSAGGAPLTDADSALAELTRAEGEVSSLLGPAGAPQPQATAAPQAEATVASGGSAPPPPQPAEPASKQAVQLADRPADACSIACRALASMERAASHLCGLSGEADPSCTSARERVKNATDRVSARCPCSP